MHPEGGTGDGSLRFPMGTFSSPIVPRTLGIRDGLTESLSLSHSGVTGQTDIHSSDCDGPSLHFRWQLQAGMIREQFVSLEDFLELSVKGNERDHVVGEATLHRSHPSPARQGKTNEN